MQTRNVFDIKVIKDLPGFLSFEVKGKNTKIFEKECGGHRWSRIPPNEKRGRVHTSSVTVAVLDNYNNKDIEILDRDVSYRTYKASGKGGQHRNKVESAVEYKHIPTGITAHCESERSQAENKRLALDALKQKVQDHYSGQYDSNRTEKRREQIGTGLRGDKVQTVQEQNGLVTNHETGKKISFKKYLKGGIDLLH